MVKGKLIYYLDQMRDNQKGEIVIAGATAVASASRGDEEKKFYFETRLPAETAKPAAIAGAPREGHARLVDPGAFDFATKQGNL